jgi:hypothetical protein
VEQLHCDELVEHRKDRNEAMDEMEQDDAASTAHERSWNALNTTFDIEAWIDHLNRDLQRLVGMTPSPGAGVCFVLGEGGEIFLHTTSEGNVLLDVTPEAQWVAPLISAATGVAAPVSSLWMLPDQVLTQLILGLSPLIASSRLVARHDFMMKKNRAW